MTQQPESDLVAVAPALQTKLQQFTAALSPTDQAQLQAIQAQSDVGALPPALREEAARVAAALTPQEAALVRLLAQRAGAGTLADEEADVAGHMIAQERERAATQAQDANRWSVPGSVGGTVATGVAVGVLIVVASFTLGVI